MRGREGEARKKGKKEAGERESLREGVFGKKKHETAREREGKHRREGRLIEKKQENAENKSKKKENLREKEVAETRRAKK